MNHWTLVKTAMFMSSGFSAIRWKFGKSFLCWAQLWFISKLLPNIPGTGKASHIAPFPSTIVSSIKCKSLTFYVQGWPFLWTCLFWCWRKKEEHSWSLGHILLRASRELRSTDFVRWILFKCDIRERSAVFLLKYFKREKMTGRVQL